MRTPIQKACEIAGGQTALARSLTEITKHEITQQRVHNWVMRGDEVPTEFMAAIEQITNGEVTRRDLRPDDWDRVWPELADKADGRNRRSTDLGAQ